MSVDHWMRSSDHFYDIDIPYDTKGHDTIYHDTKGHGTIYHDINGFYEPDGTDATDTEFDSAFRCTITFVFQELIWH